MKRISWGFVIIAVLVTGLFSFQNCSKMGGFSTDEALIDTNSLDQGSNLSESTSDDDSGINGVGSTSGSTGSSGGSTGSTSGGSSTSGGATGGVTGGSSAIDIGIGSSPEVCFYNYYTIFAWTNSEADLWAVAPAAGAKLRTFRVYNASAVPIPAVSPSGPGWTIGARMDMNADGTSSQTNLIIAKNGNDPELDSSGNVVQREDGHGPQAKNSLYCYFGPQANSTVGLSIPPYENVGVDPLVNHVGFIGSTKKWVACKVNRGTAKLNFRSADGSSFDLDANKPFIVKRGCFQ